MNVQPVVAGDEKLIDAGRDTMTLRVERVEHGADKVLFLTFVDPAGGALPTWEPGAHLDLSLPSGLSRQYSLCGDPHDTHRYTVAVLRVDDGRGGSLEIHNTDLVGSTLQVRGPTNHFKLIDAPSYLLLAGGIGITPIVAMARELQSRGSQWQLTYAARTASAMVFAEELSSQPDRVRLLTDDVDGLPDFSALIAAQPARTAVYCCGPEPMIRHIEDVCEANSSATLHTERFAPSGKVAAPTGGERSFEIELRRRGVVLTVEPDQNALDVVREVVRNHPYSCQEGTCGSCEVSVLGGTIDHRDDVLSDDERAANDVMMLCVSRAFSDRLIIDL